MAVKLEVPGRGAMVLEHLVLDLNGTLALDGVLEPGVAEAVSELGGDLTCHLVTADTFGTAAGLFGGGVTVHRINPVAEDVSKRDYVRSLGAYSVAAMGNGANDALMLAEAGLGICVLGPEGAASAALSAANVVVTSGLAGLSLLLKPQRLVATLRK